MTVTINQLPLLVGPRVDVIDLKSFDVLLRAFQEMPSKDSCLTGRLSLVGYVEKKRGVKRSQISFDIGEWS